MLTSALQKLVVIAAVIVLATISIRSQAAAATITTQLSQNEMEMGCGIAVRGFIADGDASDLTAAVADLEVYELSSKPRLCLDSPGGSFVEAVRIVEAMRDFPVLLSTAVAEDARCESACSIIFMAGLEGGRLESPRPMRIMHPRSRLGFHSPNLELSSGEYSHEDVERSFFIAMEAISRLLSTRATTASFSDSLIIEMLATAPSEMFYIETVHQAARWLISVAPVDLPNYTALAPFNACRNTEIFLHDGNFLDAQVDNDLLEQIQYDPVSNSFDVLLQTAIGWRGPLTCLVASVPEGMPGAPGIEISISRPSGSMLLSHPQFLFFDPNSLLTDLPSSTGLQPFRGDSFINWIQADRANAPTRLLSEPGEMVYANNARNSEVAMDPSGAVGEFDRPHWCPRASTATELAICSSEDLSTIDILIANAFERIRSNEAARALARDRLSMRNSCGADLECIYRITQQTLLLLEEF